MLVTIFITEPPTCPHSWNQTAETSGCLKSLVDCSIETCLTLSLVDAQHSPFILADTTGFQHLYIGIHGHNIHPEQEPESCEVVPLVLFTQDEQQGMMGQGRSRNSTEHKSSAMSCKFVNIITYSLESSICVTILWISFRYLPNSFLNCMKDIDHIYPSHGFDDICFQQWQELG